jgi:hypothetical protein
MVERTTRQGQLQEQRTTYQYDARDNPIEESEEGHSREIGLNDAGEPTRVEQPVRIRVIRSEYTYDPHDNWTERVVSQRCDVHAGFQRSNVERRTLSYY